MAESNQSDANHAGVIAQLADVSVPDFIRSQVNAKTLHRTVQALNRDVLSGDRDRRNAAREALARLAFI